jgi:signal transduction histidine kinase
MASGNEPKRPGRRKQTPLARRPRPTRSNVKVDPPTELEAAQELREALEQQAALRDVLGVISRSPFALDPVLDTVIQSAVRLSGADSGSVSRVENGVGSVAAHVGMTDEAVASMAELYRAHPLVPGRRSLTGRVLMDRQSVQIPDVSADPDYEDSANYPRSLLGVPLLGPDGIVGVIVVRRRIIGGVVVGFSSQQVQLVEAFAAQAVIAIENVRLFNETKEALARQTATSELLAAMSESAFDLQPVFELVLDKSLALCHAEYGWFHQFNENDETFRQVAGRMSAAMAPIGEREERWRAPDASLIGRVSRERQTLHVADIMADPTVAESDRLISNGARTALGVPLLRGDQLLGAIIIVRIEVRPFEPREIELVESFARQAAIAIENVRLFNETKEALARQTATAELLAAMSESAFDLKPVLEMVLDKSIALCKAEYGWIRRFDADGTTYRRAARTPNDMAIPLMTNTAIKGRHSVMGRVFRERQTIHVADISTDPTVADSPAMIAIGARTGLGVPLLRGDDVLGAIVLARIEVRPFEAREIELVESFARQASIAIENTRLLNEIQDKSRQLEAASKHKSEFLANMSHELRTPLNAIIGFSDVLEQRLFGELNDKQADYNRDIGSSGRHLLDLVNEILDLSKVEAGRMELEPSEFALADTIRGALGFVRERAASHRIALTADLATDLGTVVADERKVRQVLLNLLSNAVKFTPDGGTIGVQAHRRDAEVEVSVSDTGIGIAPEDRAKVFDEFQQVGKASDRSREGTGLGLTLAKRFIELHGGRIWIESELGKGTTFTFGIPVNRTLPVVA